MVCRLCGEDVCLVDSHIVPRSFYPLDGSLRLLSSREEHYPKRRPIGIYDQILCGGCEARFSPWDDYAHELLIAKRGEFESIKHNGEVYAFVRPSYHYDLLKLFVLSVLWRATVSTQNGFAHVNIGRFEPILREMLSRNCPGDSESFSTVLSVFDVDGGMLSPGRTKIDQVNYWVFFLGPYVAHIKVDQRKAPAAFAHIALANAGGLCVLRREFKGSHEHSVMKKIALVHAGLRRRT